MQHSSPTRPTAPGLTLDDVYHVLFRHKWKILVLSVVGLIAAGVIFIAMPPAYVSEAKILIRYVVENKSVGPDVADTQVKSPDSRGENVINSELEILTSLDLALQVAEAVGPAKIMARAGGGTNRFAAAGVIRSGITAEVPKKSNIIKILFSHRDREVAQPVLRQLVELYKKRHVEIHQGVGVLDDFFSRQADQLRARLTQTEEDLKKLKTEARIIVLGDTMKAFVTDISRIQEAMLAAEAELAERKSILAAFQKGSTNTMDKSPFDGLPADIVTRYQEVRAQLDSFQKRRQEVFNQGFTEEHPLAKRLQEQITAAETDKKKMEAEHPKLAGLSGLSGATNVLGNDLSAEYARAGSLAAKIRVLGEQLERTRAEARKVVDAEPAILQLQRKRDLEEANLRYYSSSLERARVDESLGAGKITNIGIVQEASPPSRDTRKVIKPVGGAAAGGILAGLALAFLLDLVLNRSIKRGSDVERRLGLPLFLTIPDMGWRSGLRLTRLSRNGHRKDAVGASELPPESPNAAVQSVALAPWDEKHELHPYHEALRDRLMTYFEVRNMNHKPKMVAVTSCHPGAGVTNLAAGLAASLSETGDGNVLLVDMNSEQGAAYPFQRGHPVCGLSEAFEPDKSGTALVQGKLYVASAYESKDSQLPRVLPKRFASLVPKMKASDYDYIIFDMPPVSQTSVTPRLSGYMDMVLMVVQSEKTGQDVLKRAGDLLHESGATMAAVLNKHRQYVPASLSQEL